MMAFSRLLTARQGRWGEVGVRQAVRGQHIQWQVVALAGQVHTQVLPEIDELQGRAYVVAFDEALHIGHAVQVQQQTTHRVG
mgnify:CR=1 FL=1